MEGLLLILVVLAVVAWATSPIGVIEWWMRWKLEQSERTTLHRGLHVWSLKRYCVTVMDNWTYMRLFWTLEGAKKFYRKHRTCANIFVWDGKEWQWQCGARDIGVDTPTPSH